MADAKSRAMRKTLLSLVGVALVGIATVTNFAQAQNTVPPKVGFDPLFTNNVSAATTTAAGHNSFDVVPNAVLSFQSTILGADAGTSNVTFYFNLSNDGKNWTTDYPYSVIMAANATTAATYAKPVATNPPARFMSLDRISTPQTNVIVTNGILVWVPQNRPVP